MCRWLHLPVCRQAFTPLLAGYGADRGEGPFPKLRLAETPSAPILPSPVGRVAGRVESGGPRIVKRAPGGAGSRAETGGEW
jgi:hypothetical protein